MIKLKTEKELDCLREAGRISHEALMVAGQAVKPGATTYDIDRICYEYIKSQKAEPNFLNLYGFPGTACISVNDEVIHGLPSKKKILKEGDIVSIDTGAKIDGWNGDNAYTFYCGEVQDNARVLCETTKKALEIGISQAIVGNRVGDIGFAIQSFCEGKGYGVVREYTGHGVGRELHEDPSVANYGAKGRGVRLLPGMVIAIEPMINEGTERVYTMNNNWTVKTVDGKLSAHFENTIAITKDGPVILTRA